MADNQRTGTKTYRVSPEVKAAIAAAAEKHGGVDKALRRILIEHPKRCQGERPEYDVKDAKTILVEKIPDDSVEGQLRRQIERQQL
jgi:hypothetical protein